MFELIPFDRRGRSVSAYDPFRVFDELERSFFGNGSHGMSAFRTDETMSWSSPRYSCTFAEMST